MSTTTTVPPDAVKPGAIIGVTVQGIWSHMTTYIAIVGAMIPVLIALLTQLSTLPGVPTNWVAWILSAIAVLTSAGVFYQKFFGTPMVTPTAAAEQIKRNQ